MNLTIAGPWAHSMEAMLRGVATAIGSRRVVRPSMPRAGSRPPSRRLGKRHEPHSLLADAHGVWSWAPSDVHAAATRHAGVQQWAEDHPGRDARIWWAAALTCGSASIDPDSIKGLGAQYDVCVQSMAPWWHHAFVEAKRCVIGLDRVQRAQVCVVEGVHTTWLVTEHGQLRDVRPCTLAEPSIDALQRAMRQMRSCALTVALGQGLHDGHRTSHLRALVLGRLDGEQPPQWLRPASRTVMN